MDIASGLSVVKDTFVECWDGAMKVVIEPNGPGTKQG